MSAEKDLSFKRSQMQLPKRRSRIWVSSNPDDEDEYVPPTPTLVRDSVPTPESPRSANSLENSKTSSQWARLIQNDQDSDDKILENMSRAHFTPPNSLYVPRSAAKGFLASTNVASDATRRTWRKSAMFGDNQPMVCLTNEHRQEWERMKQLVEALEGRGVP